jgi:hypothetical protein
MFFFEKILQGAGCSDDVFKKGLKGLFGARFAYGIEDEMEICQPRR